MATLGNNPQLRHPEAFQLLQLPVLPTRCHSHGLGRDWLGLAQWANGLPFWQGGVWSGVDPKLEGVVGVCAFLLNISSSHNALSSIFFISASNDRDGFGGLLYMINLLWKEMNAEHPDLWLQALLGLDDVPALGLLLVIELEIRH